MDIVRKPDPKKKQRKVIMVAAGIFVLLLITLGLSRLKPAAPEVARNSVWIDTVKRGPMLRQVRGTGTLVPEEITWIAAVTDARVEKIVLRPGVNVKPESVILEMSNPEVTQAAEDAEFQLKAAEAEYIRLKAQLENTLLDQKSSAATVHAEYLNAKAQAETDAALAEAGLVTRLQAEQSKSRAAGLAERERIEQERVAVSSRSVEAQMAVQSARIEQLRALLKLRREQVDKLFVRAGMDGILQQVPVEVGQQVTPGTNLARVAQPDRLKAELRIPETQAKDVTIGLPAQIDTRNGVVPGRVVRIDPAVQNGTVTVDVTLEGALPRGARPDLSIDGTIDLERLANVLYVGRPAFGKEHSTIGLFKLQEDGGTAQMAQVKVGRSSVNAVEILEGLNEGDQVILSDTSAYDNFERIRLE